MSNSEEKTGKIITIASGKGGVGKTSISVNLAMSLLDEGRRICLLDADFGMANVDVLLGLSPEHSLLDVVENRCTLADVTLSGPGSIKIIPGGSALERMPDLNQEEKGRLLAIFQELRAYDALVIDASAGLSEQVLLLLEAASIPILIVVPEPTSLTDAYSLLKAYQKRGNRGPVFVLINQAKSPRHAARVYKKFKEVVDKFLTIAIEPIGFVMSDDRVSEAVSMQTPFVTLFPNSPASHCMRRIATTISSNHDAPGNAENLERVLSQSETSGPGGSAEESQSALPRQPDNDEKIDEQPEISEFSGDIVNLLVKEGHITLTQLDYANNVRQKLDTPVRLLELLKDLGYLSEDHLKETLIKNRTGIRLGSLLVEFGYISEKQLAMALNQQQEAQGRKRLGDILVENNYISEYDLTQGLSVNLGIPYIEPTLEMVDVKLLEKAPKQFFLTHKLLPINDEKGSVNIAMVDPLHRSASQAARRLFGADIIISITVQKYIKDVLEAYESLKTHKKRIETDKNEIVEIVDHLINEAMKKQVSDIHIEPMKNRIRVRFRKDGSLIHFLDLSKDLEPAIVSRIKVMASANITEKRRHQDGRILMASTEHGEQLDIRVSFYITIFGEKVVMRLLTKKAELFKVKDLGMGPKMLDRFKEDVLDLPSGVVIITGPTGAGKTTTLYASINYCNHVTTNIITAEEPVEYVIEGIAQCSIDPKIGLTYEETLRHILRQDPDIIILGEIRDKLSAESAIQAALTGHKVLTTFHTEDSIGGLLRLMNMDIESFLISSTVVCVVAQRLLRKVCPRCRQPYAPTARDLRRLQYPSRISHNYDFQLGSGCAYCDFTGYRGRIGVFELLVLNEYVKEAILNRKTSYQIRRISMETTGLVTLLEDGLAKAARGITSIPEVINSVPLVEPPRSLDQIYRLTGEI